MKVKPARASTRTADFGNEHCANKGRWIRGSKVAQFPQPQLQFKLRPRPSFSNTGSLVCLRLRHVGCRSFSPMTDAVRAGSPDFHNSHVDSRLAEGCWVHSRKCEGSLSLPGVNSATSARRYQSRRTGRGLTALGVHNSLHV